jgi:hypothetical protein
MAFGWYGFIDERGEPNLETEKPGTSHYFILAAVLVNGAHLDAIRAAVEVVRARHFQTGQMRSRSIAKAKARRLRVLADLAPIDFRAFVLVVDKTALKKDGGFVFRQPFTKFFHGIIHDRLFYAYPELRLVADPFGRPEFQQEFKRYLEARVKIDLFRTSIFDWGEKDDPLLQLADMVAGSLGAALEPDSRSITVDEFDAALQGKVTYEWWPPYKHPKSAATDAVFQRDANDGRARDYCVRKAVGFIQTNSGKRVDELRCQVAATKVLLELCHSGDGRASMLQGVLAEHVAEMVPGVEMKGSRWFQRNVIAGLRDAGVIITSGPQGYKLPTSVADLRAYVRDVQGRVMPMLGRLKNARQQLLTTTGNQVDILSGDEFVDVRPILDLISFPYPEDDDEDADIADTEKGST